MPLVVRCSLPNSVRLACSVHSPTSSGIRSRNALNLLRNSHSAAAADCGNNNAIRRPVNITIAYLPTGIRIDITDTPWIAGDSTLVYDDNSVQTLIKVMRKLPYERRPDSRIQFADSTKTKFRRRGLAGCAPLRRCGKTLRRRGLTRRCNVPNSRRPVALNRFRLRARGRPIPA